MGIKDIFIGQNGRGYVTQKEKKGTSFKDLSSYNKALVAKQSWRIIQFPNLLLVRVLQAKYFKHSEFLGAKLGYQPSFIWRSILWGR